MKIDIGRYEDWIRDSRNMINIFENTTNIPFNGRDQNRTKVDLKYNNDMFYTFVILNDGNGRTEQYQSYHIDMRDLRKDKPSYTFKHFILNYDKAYGRKVSD